MTRRICLPITTRGNYGKLKSTIRALHDRDDCEVQIVLGGAMVLDRYGEHEAILAADGFAVAAKLDYIVAGETLSAMTQSAARCSALFGEVLEQLRPDVVMITADRYEALALAQSALCMNVLIAHLEGGEASGSIDDSIRHAVTKLAHLHFPANAKAGERVRQLGEHDATIHVVGTPSLDILAELDLSEVRAAAATLADRGDGADIDLAGDYVVVSLHPVVTEVEEAAAQYAVLADAIRDIGLPAVWVLPNLDAGAAEVNEPVRRLQADAAAPPVRVVGSLPLESYATILRHARVLVGNSSSGIREAAFLGVPVVNIGTRQQARGRGRNVVDVPEFRRDEIVRASRAQIEHGPYQSDPLYGDGSSGRRIAEVLTGPLPALQKAAVW